VGWSRFFRRRYWDEERAREIEAHLAQEIDDNVARGMSRDEARSAAYRAFGNPTVIREEVWHMNTVGFIETLWQDVRYGLRLLRRDPTFAVVAILTLALGTGANTAIFQLVDALRLRSLPVSHPEELADIRIVKAPHGRTGSFNGRWPMLSYPLFQKIREDQRAFVDVGAWGTATFDLAEGGESRPAQAVWVSGNLFSLLGIRPAAGRLFVEADDVKGCAAPGVVLGYGFWQREYGSNPSVIGTSILLEGHRLDILGVTSAEFFGLDVGRTFDVAVPICSKTLFRGTDAGLDRSDIWFLAGVGRLKPGVTLAEADAQLATLSKGIQAATVPPRYTAADAKDYLAMQIGALPASGGFSGLRRNYEDSLNMLLGATALVLLIACANLANLMLARATSREREVAVRLAIGASRRRVIRQMLSESLVIAIAGGAAGLLAAQWLSRGLVAFLSSSQDPLSVDLSLDWRAFAFTASVAAAACLLFGLAPAVRVTSGSPASTMKAGARGATDGRERFGIRRTLVVVQVALSLVLVVGALLFTRSLRNLTTMDAGFRQDGILTVSLDMERAHIPANAHVATNDRLIDAVRAVPGVTMATRAFTTPVGGNFWNERVMIDSVLQEEPVNINSVGAGYFRALDIPLIAGRDFDPRDVPTSPKVAIVSQSFAKKFFPGGNAIGRSFQFEQRPGESPRVLQIVGISADTKYTNLREPFLPLVYLAATQEADPGTDLMVVVRSAIPPQAITPAISAAITGVSPAIAIQYQTVRALVSESLLRDRLMAMLSAFFGGLAVVIAMVGLYGVMSYMVTRRRMEIGIRMALGADGGRVTWLVVREAGILLCVGLVAGATLAVFVTRFATALLYDLKPGDPVTIVLSMAVMATVTLLASWIPAFRASRVPPTVALRQE
jgi:predicted permease